jgi:hypothetical protein
LQIKVLVDAVVGDAMKYPVKYITAPALMMISKTKDLAPAKRRYPHIGRLVEAFISPLLATVWALIIPIHGLHRL